MSTIEVIFYLALVLPAGIGAFTAWRKTSTLISASKVLDTWVKDQLDRTMGKEDLLLVRYVKKPVLQLMKKLYESTEGIPVDSHRAGLRLAGTGYITLGLAAGVALIISAAIILLGLIVIVMLAAVKDGRVIGRSVEKTGFLGRKYTQHMDAAGKVVGESETKIGILGNVYTEHRDITGHVTGTSTAREGLFGHKYVEHLDSSGKVTGRSTTRESPVAGQYVETIDASGNVVCVSRERKGLNGDRVIEHTDA